METALSRGDNWEQKNAEVDQLLGQLLEPNPDEMQEQIKKTSDAFAIDMLLLKFVQGLPLVGVIGGLGNPVYYNKVMHYARLKYYKRYVLDLQKQIV